MAKLGITSLDEIYENLKNENVDISDKYPYSHPIKTKNKSINLSLGRIWFNLLMPDNFRLIDEPVTKSKMGQIIKEIINNNEPSVSCDIISKLQEEAFKLSAINPRSFNIEAFLPSNEWIKQKEEFVKIADTLSDDDFLKRSTEIAEMLMKELSDKQIPIQDVMISGTKGSISDWQSLMVSRGFVVDLEGNISRIVSAENDGKDIESYYKAGGQGRRNYYVRSTLTAQPGYLARKVTMASANIKINKRDCRVKKYLTKYIDKSNVNSFMFRYYKDLESGDITLLEDPSKIIGKNIEFRSPLYCKDKEGICEICYGELSNKLNNKNIGVIAGGAINNETINALMKMRHKATQVDLIEVDFTKLKNKIDASQSIISSIFNITKNTIFANTDLSIIINKNEYRNESFIDYGDKFVLPGIIEVYIGNIENGDIITLPFNFNINLFKPTIVEEHNSIITLKYTKGEKIINKDKYIKETNMLMIDRLFEGVFKYINDPKILLDIMSQELAKTDSVHLEIVVSNMFRSNEDPTIPGRLVNYRDVKIYGMKKLPFISSWLSALSFENINKAVKTGLIEHKDAEFNPIEKVVLEKHMNDDANL